MTRLVLVALGLPWLFLSALFVHEEPSVHPRMKASDLVVVDFPLSCICPSF
jgi:hypothetical protein